MSSFIRSNMNCPLSRAVDRRVSQGWTPFFFLNHSPSIATGGPPDASSHPPYSNTWGTGFASQSKTNHLGRARRWDARFSFKSPNAPCMQCLKLLLGVCRMGLFTFWPIALAKQYFTISLLLQPINYANNFYNIRNLSHHKIYFWIFFYFSEVNICNYTRVVTNMSNISNWF